MAGLFEIGKSGLNSYREALSVTGQNIANINTDGYKRREASLEEVKGASGGITSLSSQAGLGVRVEEVRRSFDEFLLNKARSATSYATSADSYVNAIAQLEDIILPGEANIGAAIGRFMQTLQEVAVNPSDTAPRIVALQSGETLADMFHQTASLIDELQTGVSTQAEQALTEVNLLSKSLANINRNIASSGGKAQNALLDNRDAIIDKISEYVEVTVSLENSGSSIIRLGNSGNGPKLVAGEKAFTLSASTNTEDLQFFLAEGASVKRTSQVSNGSLRGLADAYKSASDAIRSINHLAYQFINDINNVHMQGLDLEGQAGIEMFHGIAFDAVPSVSNLGNGSGIVDILDTDQISNDPIRFSYDADQSLWRAYDQYGANIASGKHQISLPGLNIEFSGDPVGGDEMLLQPAEGAAKNITFALTRPEQIAAASGFLVSANINNRSDAQIEISADKTGILPVSQPFIQDIISNTHSTVSSSQFIRDGAIAIIPANTDHIDLISMIQQSKAQFGISADAMPQISTLSLVVDDAVNVPQTYNFDLAGYADRINQQSQETSAEPFTWYSAKQIADLMNVGALTATLANDPDSISYSLNAIGGFANGSDGTLSLALKENAFSEGTITFGNSPSSEAAITDRIESASDIQIFTREGRHIAGSAYADIADLVNTDNGFMADAEYRDEYLNKSGDDGYMGVGVNVTQDISGEILNVESTDNGYQISFDRLIGIDTDEASPFGLRSSSGQFDYQLSIDQFTVALNEGNVDGDTGEAIAKAALANIRAHAPIPSMTGVSQMVASSSFVITDDQRTLLNNNGTISLEHEGISYAITNTDATYTVTGGPATGLSITFDAASNTISSQYVNLPDEDESVTIAFEGYQYKINMSNGEVVVTGGEEGRINASITSDHKLQITATNGSINKDNFTILDDAELAGNTANAEKFGLISLTSTAQTIFSNVDVSYAKTVTQNQAGDRNPDITTYPVQNTSFQINTLQAGDATTNEIQELTGITDTDLLSFSGNQLNLDFSNTNITVRFDSAPENLDALVTRLNTEANTANLHAGFALNADSTAVNYVFGTDGDQALGEVSLTTDIPEIQTIAGFTINDLAKLEHNRLTFSDGTSALNVDFTTPPTSLSNLVQILNDEAISNGFAATFGADTSNDAITATWAHGENLDLLSVNLIETYDIPQLDISISGNMLYVEKNDSYVNDDIIITSNAMSNAGGRITLTELPEEELIVFLTGSDDGNGSRARNISAVYDQHPADMILPKRDISITVTDATNGIVEFVDTATGTSLATRHLDENGMASALGFTMKVTGTVANDDVFNLTNAQDGIHDNRNLLDLIALQNSTTDKGGFQKIFSGLIAEIGADIQASRLNAEAANTLKDASLEAEAMYSGVNLDTEASKLIELQQAYQASARILQTARELFDTLLQTI